MKNLNFPRISFLLIGLVGKMVKGMDELASVLIFTLITKAQMEANLAAFITQDGLYNAARSKADGSYKDWTSAQADIYTWLLAVSRMLTIKWGTGWTTQWAQAGFITPTTAIPGRIEDRLGLTLALVNFFTIQPGYEVPDLQLTAAEGTRLRDAALAAQGAVNSAEVAFKHLNQPWQTAYDTLTKGMRDLVMNLTSLLAKNDPRWKQFGLQMPITKSTPGQPQNVAVQLQMDGSLLVSCDANPLTTRYRWRALVMGLEINYRLVAGTTEPLATVPGAEPGQTLQIIVQAVNESLQGVASEPVFFTMPLVAKPAPAVETATPLPIEDSVPAPRRGLNGGNGNGHTNGHGSASRL